MRHRGAGGSVSLTVMKVLDRSNTDNKRLQVLRPVWGQLPAQHLTRPPTVQRAPHERQNCIEGGAEGTFRPSVARAWLPWSNSV